MDGYDSLRSQGRFATRGAGRAMSRGQFLLAAGGAVLVAYCLLVAAMFLLQRRLIYFPDLRVPEPVAAGAAVQVEHLHTGDGLSLLAWYSPPPRPDRCVIMFLHGNAGNIGDRAHLLARLTALGFGVMLPEYRGYGGNPGSPSEVGLMRDADAALSLLQARGVPPNRTVLWGESLGTGIAIRLAARSRVAALILQSPYTSLVALARRQFPWIPGLRLLLRDRFDSLADIGGIRSPILVMIAGNDRVIPPEMSRSLLAAARAPVQLWEAPEADHNDLQAFGAVDAAAAFLDRLGERGCGANNPGNW
jgi:uncharacterized protein